jgi:hypothetical protein
MIVLIQSIVHLFICLHNIPRENYRTITRTSTHKQIRTNQTKARHLESKNNSIS